MTDVKECLFPEVVAGLTGRLPVLGRLTRFVAEQELTLERVLDFGEDLYLLDHLFVCADCKPPEERLLIVPLTMSMELVAQAAGLLAPGLGMIGFENVQGRRWVGLRDCRTTLLRFEAKVHAVDPATGACRIQTSMYFEDKVAFSAVVLFAADYRNDLDLSLAQASENGCWPFTSNQVYGERLTFHGPRFQVVAALGAFGDPASTFELVVPPKDRLFASNPDPLLVTDPCTFDGIGQAFGLWARAHGQYILPVGFDKMEIYRATPPVGTRCPLRIEVLEFNIETRVLRCNIELEDGAGYLWARISNWTDWMLRWPDKCECVSRLPRHPCRQPDRAFPPGACGPSRPGL